MPTTSTMVVDSRIRVNRVTTRPPLPPLNDQYSVVAKALFGTSSAPDVLPANAFYAGVFALNSAGTQAVDSALAGITNAQFLRVFYKSGPAANPVLTVSIAGWITSRPLKRLGYIDVGFGELTALPAITLTAGTFTGTTPLVGEVYIIGNT